MNDDNRRFIADVNRWMRHLAQLHDKDVDKAMDDVWDRMLNLVEGCAEVTDYLAGRDPADEPEMVAWRDQASYTLRVLEFVMSELQDIHDRQQANLYV